MNNKRREKIAGSIKLLENVKNTLQEVLDEEQLAFDNMPENLQYSTRGEEAQEAIDYISEAIECLDNAIEQLESIN